ncbi:TPA: hypothetical protein SGZ69_000410 [Campylobacter jejuni]|nr:hypothetical protein [Campylobacter jejuni]HEH3976790.1 hypothetical protein [Campylobacter jejuni]
MMMKIVFKGKSSEYEIQRSCFCVDAFVIKDKIEERDGVDFITSNVDLLEFSDDSFTFEEIVKHFNICDSEDMIIVEDFCRRKNKISIWKNKTSIKVEILFFYKP